MYLLFQTNYTETTSPVIGDGSYLKLIECEEGWFTTENLKSVVDEQGGWTYTEVESITPMPDPPEL